MLKIIKDEKIKSPYENIPNHPIINELYNKNKLTKKFNSSRNIKFYDEGYKKLNSLGKSHVNKLRLEIIFDPIPPKNYDENWHQLKQFTIVDGETNKEINAFIASAKIGEDYHRLTYMVIGTKTNKTYSFDITFLSCWEHQVPKSDEETETEFHTYSKSQKSSSNKLRYTVHPNLKNFSEKYQKMFAVYEKD